MLLVFQLFFLLQSEECCSKWGIHSIFFFFLVPYIWIESCSPLQAAEKEYERSHYKPLTTIMLWNIFYPNTVCFTFSHHLSLLVFIVYWDTIPSLVIMLQIIPIMCPVFQVMMMMLEREKKTTHSTFNGSNHFSTHWGRCRSRCDWQLPGCQSFVVTTMAAAGGCRNERLLVWAVWLWFRPGHGGQGLQRFFCLARGSNGPRHSLDLKHKTN